MTAILQSVIAASVSNAPYVAPSNLSVTTASPASLSVDWKDNSSGETGFQLQYMVNDIGAFNWIDAPVPGGIIAGANVQSVNLSLTWPQFSKMDFRIRAVGPLGESAWSPTFTLITSGTEPFNFYVERTPSVTEYYFTATWQEVSNAEIAHRIEVRRNNGEFVYAADAPANATSILFPVAWQDFDVLAFRIKAVGNYGDSAWSELRFLTMPGFTAPTNLTVSSYDNTTAGSVTLSWDAYPTPVTGFSDPKLRVERREAGGPWFYIATALPITATTFTDLNTSNSKESSTTYDYRVMPTQGGFVSKNASNIVSITTPFLYSRTYMESDSLITFLRPQLEIPTGPTIPPVPKIMISAANNSFQRVYTLLTGTTPNRFFRARFEGASTSFPTAPGNSNMEWEIVFSEALPNRIDIHIGQNGRDLLSYKGLSGVYSESALIAEIQNSPFGLANVAFRIETTAGAATVTQIPLALLGGFSMNKIYEGHQNSSFRQLQIPWPVSYLGTNY